MIWEMRENILPQQHQQVAYVNSPTQSGSIFTNHLSIFIVLYFVIIVLTVYYFYCKSYS